MEDAVETEGEPLLIYGPTDVEWEGEMQGVEGIAGLAWLIQACSLVRLVQKMSFANCGILGAGSVHSFQPLEVL